MVQLEVEAEDDEDAEVGELRGILLCGGGWYGW
jgi:hypothetical protein